MNPDLKSLLKMALDEDCPQGDITTDFFLSSNSPAKAILSAKEPGIFYGEEVIQTIFEVLCPFQNKTGPATLSKSLQSPISIGSFHDLKAGFHFETGINTNIKLEFTQKNAATLSNQDVICTLEGPLPILLKAERVMLNITQHLSGIATTTKAFVQALNNPKIDILDTRKTTPLYRSLERHAVLAGGGKNHRFSLSDMVLLKENHLAGIEKAGHLSRLKELMVGFKHQHPTKKIEIEIETLDQLKTLDLSEADYILLDNFNLDLIEPAVTLCQLRGFKAEIEISGNVTLDTISRYAHLPIHRISVGSLTHSPKALDLSLRIC